MISFWVALHSKDMMPEDPTWKTKNMCITYLWDRVLVERGVLACHVDQIEGNDVAHSLDFMDDCISIGHVIPITHRGLSGWTNDSVDLCLDSLCTQWQQETVWVRKMMCNTLRTDLSENPGTTKSGHLQKKQALGGTDITHTHLVCEDSRSCITVPSVK